MQAIVMGPAGAAGFESRRNELRAQGFTDLIELPDTASLARIRGRLQPSFALVEAARPAPSDAAAMLRRLDSSGALAALSVRRGTPREEAGAAVRKGLVMAYGRPGAGGADLDHVAGVAAALRLEALNHLPIDGSSPLESIFPALAARRQLLAWTPAGGSYDESAKDMAA